MEIKLFDIFHTDTLRDRQTAHLLVERISKIPDSTPVVIDFDRITFASRSFCHELLVSLTARQNIQFENVNEMVKAIMIASLKKPEINNNISPKIKIIA